VGRRCIVRGFLLLEMLTLGSCSILETRDPEPPGQSSSTFTPPTSPNIVLDNLVSAVRERNTDNYIKCLADSNFSTRRFSFVPTQEAQSQYFTVFSSWSIGGERGYFENLKSRTTSTATSLLLFSNGSETIQSDSAVYTRNYDLIYQHNVGGIPQEAKGTLQFYLGTDRNGLWMIYRWVDIKGNSDFTWSDFKGRFSN
jgi:hypothetical protein